jgi:hypothetical protein
VSVCVGEQQHKPGHASATTQHASKGSPSPSAVCPGTVKDKRVPPVGSPFQLNFNPGANSSSGGTPAVPPEITPAHEALPSCGDPLFQCSCADCPPAPGCKAVSVRSLCVAGSGGVAL